MDLQALIMQVLQANPHLAVIVTVMAVARAICKPAMTLIQAYVDATPTKADDAWLGTFRASGIYKALSWLVDFGLSIKLPQVEVQKTAPTAETK